jgi:serine/threonine protein kinase
MTSCPECGASLVEVKRDPFIGRNLAERYKVECLVGVGGMGVVYRAWHEALRRQVAVKVLRQQFLNDPVSVKRFQQEAIAASRLNHPNIVSLHDFGSTEDGYLYMVMDLLDGRSLAQEEKDRQSLGVERTIRIIKQVCDALEHAHQNGIVHRDLKPGNIMLMKTNDNPDFVKLVDFGIAKVLTKEEDLELTQKGEVFGSPLYMSPEQCLGMDLDGRSDIYAVGAMLYEALTGHVPHIGKNMIETIDRQIHQQPAPFKEKRPDIYIPERLEAVVLRALSKRAEDRQQSMKELSLDLSAAVPRLNQGWQPQGPNAPVAQASGKLPLIIISSIVGLLVLIGAAFLFVYNTAGGVRKTPEVQPAVPSPTVPSGAVSVPPVQPQSISTPSKAAGAMHGIAPTGPLPGVTKPSANQSAPAANQSAPAANQSQSAPNQLAPAANQSAPAANQSQSAPNQFTPPAHPGAAINAQPQGKVNKRPVVTARPAVARHGSGVQAPVKPVAQKRAVARAPKSASNPWARASKSDPWGHLHLRGSGADSGGASKPAAGADPWAGLKKRL